MKKLSTNTLIIGSGGAGLRLAIELYENGKKDILVVGDCKFRDAHTTMAEGGVNASFNNMPDEHDSPMVHALDTYTEGHEVGHPKIVEDLTNNAQDAINDLVDMGADFHRETNGKISQRYFGAHTYRRTIFKGDHTGQEILRVLCDRVEKLGIPNVNELFITKLLVADGTIYGAIGINKEDEMVLIEAPVVVLATGGHSNIYNRSSSRRYEGFGEATAMALREGAEVGDMEMVQFHPTGLVWPEDVAGELVTEAVRGEGGILTNVLGERFMERYDPKKKELSTRDVVARANYHEIIEGRGTKRGAVYLDITSRTKDEILELLPKMYKQLKEWNNIDISKEKMEVAPTAHYAMGGLHVDENTYETTIHNLYAIGECTTGVHGANRLGGNSLAEILVFGKLLGKHLAKEKVASKDISDAMVKEAQTEIESMLLKDGKLDTEKTLAEARDIMWKHAGIARTEAQLQEGLKAIETLRAKITEQGLSNGKSDYESVTTKMRVYAVLDLGEAVISGAIARQESRGAHYREDYKEKSPKFNVNFWFKRKGDKLEMTSTPFPEPSAALKKALQDFDEEVKLGNYTHQE